jgi:ribosomal protein S18 acetylase RimI-like enzyme
MQIREYKGQPKQIAGMAILLEKLKGATQDYDRVDVELSDIDYYIDNYLSNAEYSTFMAHTDNKYVGFIVGYHLLNDTYKLVMLYVDPEYRGQRLAYELKQRLAEYAKERGYKRIVSCIRTDHYASIQLNEKSGWKAEPDKVNKDKYLWYTKELQ